MTDISREKVDNLLSEYESAAEKTIGPMRKVFADAADTIRSLRDALDQAEAKCDPDTFAIAYLKGKEDGRAEARALIEKDQANE